MSRFRRIFTILLFSCAISAGFAKDVRAENGESAAAGPTDENWENRRKIAPSGDNSMRLKEIVEPNAEYNYASFGRPDPFIEPDLTSGRAVVAGPSTQTIRMTSPLQAFNVTELRVKGVWQTRDGEVRAIIQTPKGEGVVVKKDDPISSGKVLSIDRDKIMVRVYRLRSDGVREYEDLRMQAGLPGRAQPGIIQLEPGQAPKFINSTDGVQSISPQVPATATLQGAVPTSPVAPAAGTASGLLPQGTQPIQQILPEQLKNSQGQPLPVSLPNPRIGQ